MRKPSFRRLVETKDSRVRSVALRCSAAAAILLAGCSTEGKNDTSMPSPEALTATRAIASRYDCSLISATDLHTTPKTDNARSFGKSDQRTTLQVKVNLHDTNEARPFIEKYQNDSTVQWVAVPRTTSALRTHTPGLGQPMSTDPLYFNNRSYSVTQDGESTLESTFYPLTTYPEGSVADVYVSQSASTRSSNDKNVYSVKGTSPCGTVEFKAGSWVLGSAVTVIPKSMIDATQPR